MGHLAHELRERLAGHRLDAHAGRLRTFLEAAGTGVLPRLGQEELEHAFRRPLDHGRDGVQAVNQMALAVRCAAPTAAAHQPRPRRLGPRPPREPLRWAWLPGPRRPRSPPDRGARTLPSAVALVSMRSKSI